MSENMETNTNNQGQFTQDMGAAQNAGADAQNAGFDARNAGFDGKKMGDDISQAVNDFIRTGDYSKINGLVGAAVNSVLDGTGVVEGISWVERQLRNHENEIRRQMEFNIQRQARQMTHNSQRVVRNTTTVNRPMNLWSRARAKKVGAFSGLVQRILGWWWGSIFGIALIMAIDDFIYGVEDFSFVLIMAGLTALSVVGIVKGTKKKKRLKRAERYINTCGEKMYASIDELARAVGKSKEFVKKDLRDMMDAGIFPYGNLDKWETTFMLSGEVYDQYLQAQANQAEQEKVQEEQKQQEKASELDNMIEEGRAYMAHLHELNDRIPDETITDHLSKMERLLGELFSGVREHPEERSKLHKVMNYYLPTTVKLVEAYADFDKVSVPGQNISEAKGEIEKTLGVMNDSFEELLNNIFQNAAFDVTTDAQVLQSMLAREGLAKESNFATMNGES